jgi:hypothetical protein
LLSCPLRKKYFSITLCLIRSIQISIRYVDLYIKCRSKKILSARLDGQIFSLNTYDWFRNWFSFEDIIRLLTILNPEKDKQGVKYFSPLYIFSSLKVVEQVIWIVLPLSPSSNRDLITGSCSMSEQIVIVRLGQEKSVQTLHRIFHWEWSWQECLYYVSWLGKRYENNYQLVLHIESNDLLGIFYQSNSRWLSFFYSSLSFDVINENRSMSRDLSGDAMPVVT